MSEWHTSVRKPDSVRSVTHSGEVCPSGRLSFTSSTAWGKRVMSVREMGRLGSLYHLHVDTYMHSLMHSFTHSFIRLFVHVIIRSLTSPPTHPPTHSLTHPPTHPPTHSLTHSHTHSLARSPTHTLTVQWQMHTTADRHCGSPRRTTERTWQSAPPVAHQCCP